jgi:hypothetical protein
MEWSREVVVSESFIKIYENALSDEVCDMAMVKADDICTRKDKGSGYIHSVNDSRIDENIMSHTYDSLTEFRQEVLSCLQFYWSEYNQEFNITARSFKDIICPSIKIQKAGPGGGFFKWHHEQGGSDDQRNRFAVWMIYLNNVDKGGKTEFKLQNMAVTPKKGTLVLWPAGYTHPHRSSPDLEETKYITTGWFIYK